MGERLKICENLHIELKRNKKISSFYLCYLEDRIKKEILAQQSYWPFISPIWRRCIKPFWKLVFTIKRAKCWVHMKYKESISY